ncbi:MAG: hypothetical protein JNG90_05240 [Planctomycetaceae bacterium]|nr:hypothetical protein [Planctomycetaceae bacterium]
MAFWVLLLAAGCGGPSSTPPASRASALDGATVRRVDTTGVEVEFPRPVRLERIRVRMSGGLVHDQPTAGLRRRFFVPLDLQLPRTGRLELVAAGGTRELEFGLPSTVSLLPVTASIEAPEGQDPVPIERDFGSSRSPSVSVVVGPNRRLRLALRAENQVQARSQIEWIVELSPATRVTSSSTSWVPAAGELRTRSSLVLAQENRREVVELELPADAAEQRVRIRFRQRPLPDGEFADERLDVVVLNASLADLRDRLCVGNLTFPTNPRGAREHERAADEVRLPNPVWGAVLDWLQPTQRVRDRYAENAWQSLPVTNRTEYPLNLSIVSFITAAGRDEPLLDFAPPRWKAPKESATSEQLLRIAPGETVVAVLPVYVRPETPSGDYVRHVSVRMLGSDEPLATVSAPLMVVRGNPIASLVVLASLASVALAWCLAPWLWTRILRDLTVENLTTIALMSGAHFLIAYASRLAADVIAALTGPFAVFLAGIGNEGLTSALVAALIVLVPRVGVLTLSSLTVFLLQAMFTGQFGLVDLLMVTVSIVIQEALLWGLGVTSARRGTALGNRLTLGFGLRIALAIGLGNAAALYAQFCLATELYRLYFAGWYVAAVALLTGLVYGALGGAGGALLGFQLRRADR